MIPAFPGMTNGGAFRVISVVKAKSFLRRQGYEWSECLNFICWDQCSQKKNVRLFRAQTA